METPLLDPVLPVEGRHVLHLFFRVDYTAWDMLEGSQRIAAKTALASLVQEIRATPATQLLTCSIVSPKEIENIERELTMLRDLCAMPLRAFH